MLGTFQIACGSVPGRDHTALGANTQDAYAFWTGPDAIVVGVCDGCGSGRWSEVGARLGARLLVEALRRRAPDFAKDPERAAASAARSVLRRLRTLGQALGGPLPDVVADHFLFTALAAVVLPEETFVLRCGDGVVAVNGDVQAEAFAGNAPPYLGYALVGRPEPLAIVKRLPTLELKSLLLGTDGVVDLVRAAGARLPGRAETVGPLRRLWEDDSYFENPAALSRWLRLCARESSRIAWEARRVDRSPGLLPDDTTVVVIRRKAA